ncbi:L-aminopeptidase/D-esterase-like protein [Saccharothrix ecbatanensis]|uniref:L-aminopeptidase/D-esterase-like protein n=1 Tax=Saccharothrix ecbatanensis TaxID=1105145 RepID=A0A7W9HU85_9PSEU|nr:P1 family peptidase [Saccharothrix ecbatanensis]MBB5808044.1 L-aminopeptidase/D-esterase-like protein [Saccharothrix ecbatanensis]
MLVGRGPGVAVVLTPAGAVAGVAVRGAPVGTRELDLLDPSTLVQRVHAVVLAGGDLTCADGVVRWLAERGHGFPVGARPLEVVPIVPAAAALGLPSGDGYAACEAAAPSDIPALAVVGETAVGLVVVDAEVGPAECRRVAMSAHDGFARAGVTVPATVFAVATGRPTGTPLNDLCTTAADALERAGRNARV